MTVRGGKLCALSCALATLAALSGDPVYATQVQTAKRRLDLRSSGFEMTEEGRKVLSYIVSCALEAEVEGFITVSGKEYRFEGSEGLAPRWAEKPMNESEQRWVSACILARTNAFGIPIRVYLHAGTTALTPQRRMEEGAQDHTLFEGMFFGNIFSQDPVGYACYAPENDRARVSGILSKRVCAQPLADPLPDKRRVSACRFIITGPCSDPKSRFVGGREWTEAIQVWLKPD